MPSIPISIRNKLALDPWMKRCCVCKTTEGKIDWHHNYKYFKIQNDWWSILPLCEGCHSKARNTFFKEKLDWIMIQRGGAEMMSDIRTKYPKSDFPQRKRYLETLFSSVNLTVC